MLRPLIYALTFFHFHGNVAAQDERFFRDMFAGEFKKKERQKREVHVARSFSPFYEIDLNGDFRKEKILVENFNDQARIHIHDYRKKHLYSYTFDSFGPRSSIYKVQVRALNPKLRLLLIYVFEGKNEYVDFEGQGRVYFLTMDDLNLKGFNVYKGPVVWHEFKGHKRNYFQRFHQVSLIDFNEDGVKEVYVNFNHINKVFFYRGKGKWSTVKNNL